MNAAVSESPGPRVALSTTSPLALVQRCPWTWNVWKSLSIAKTLKTTESPTFDCRVGVLLAYARPLMHEKTLLKPVCAGVNVWKKMLNSRVGRGAPVEDAGERIRRRQRLPQAIIRPSRRRPFMS